MNLKFIFFDMKDVNLTSYTSGKGNIILGDEDGFIYFLNRQMEMTTFKAYEIRVTHLFQLKQHSILVSIGVSGFVFYSPIL